MIAISEIRLFDILKNKFKLSEADAKEIVADVVLANEKTDKVISDKIEDRFKTLKDIFLTKEDKVDLVRMNTELMKLIKEDKADIIKWVAIIITGQTALLVTLIKLFAK